jgi:hypothetical protein
VESLRKSVKIPLNTGKRQSQYLFSSFYSVSDVIYLSHKQKHERKAAKTRGEGSKDKPPDERSPAGTDTGAARSKVTDTAHL